MITDNKSLVNLLYDQTNLLEKINHDFEIFYISNIFKEIFQSNNFKKWVYKDIDTIINEIDSVDRNTGIMIAGIPIIEINLFYLFIFDKKIFLFDLTQIHQFQQIISKLNEPQLFYIDSKSHDEIQNNENNIEYQKGNFIKQTQNKSNIHIKIEDIKKGSIIIDIDGIQIDNIKIQEMNIKIIQEKGNKASLQILTGSIANKILEQICKSFIKKCQIRTQIRYLKSKTDFSENNISTVLADYESIFDSPFIYYNKKDQYIYFLKSFCKKEVDSVKRFNHEDMFYKNNINTNPYICKCFGQIEKDDYKYIINEFIDGITLDSFINKKGDQLNFFDKMRFILQITSAIQTIHLNNFFHRDLKPNNIMIDCNNDAILIDFDRSKYYNKDDKIFTMDFGNDLYSSPEQINKPGMISFSTDIYSLGKIIHFILCKEETKEKSVNCPPGYEDLYKIYSKCLEESPNLRPNIRQIYNEICQYILRTYSLFDSYYQETRDASYIIGRIYYEVKELIDKSIDYLTLSANQNNSEAHYLLSSIYHGKQDNEKYIIHLTSSANLGNSKAQCTLGKIYLSDSHGTVDLPRSKHYLTLSAQQNNSEAQYILGMIYYDDKYFDISKSIEYFELAANQNNSKAQYFLGEFNYYINKNYEKSISYLQKSANQCNKDALHLLGYIYITFGNIAKAVNYFKLASKLNHSQSQYYLGKYYYNGLFKYLEFDIKKAIFYFSLAANQNHSMALNFLGSIYYDGKYVQRYMEKAISYFKNSSNLNNQYAQNNLGVIYMNGDNVTTSISDAIHYFEMAIKHKFDTFSILNIARIYYFGKNIEINVEKSIKYLESLSLKDNIFAHLFLYFIYTYGNGTFDYKKSSIYLNKKNVRNIVINLKNIIKRKSYSSNSEQIFRQRLETFFREFDFVYSMKFHNFNVFRNFMISGSELYIKPMNYVNDNPQKESKLKELKEEFYNGFEFEKFFQDNIHA
ncbi:hypothetical protein M9Y10_007990 [Tritrichomonas musculus]|uniref:Protein kinase domain-containing protein n=1 Tax=Tritrichomonas musculus TaxID=1915356 RepID=A0ABR2J2W2_9EUKA